MANRFYITLFDNLNAQVLSGYSNYVRIVNLNTSAVTLLTEDAGNAGGYYADSVPGGNYRVQIDLPKNGTWSTKLTTKWHPVPDQEIGTAQLSQSAILQPYHFSLDVVPAGAIDMDGFNATQFERIAGVIKIKDGIVSGAPSVDDLSIGINGSGQLYVKPLGIASGNLDVAAVGDATKIADEIITGIKLVNETIPANKIIPESLTAGQMSDEILIARLFAADQIEAAHINPTLAFNTDQFERSGSPQKWQLKSTFLDTLGANVDYIVNVLDYGADTSGAGSSSQAFQDAFDAIGEGAGIVVIPPGTYLCKNLVVGPNTWIWAHGATITHDGTAPTGAPSGIFLLRSEGANISTPNNNIRIDGGTWRGNASLNGNAFDFIYCWNVNLQNCRFDTIKAFAISAVGCNYLNIDKCIDLSFTSAGSIYLNQATNTTILNSSFVSAGKTVFFNGLTGANESINVIIKNNNIVSVSSSGHSFYIDETLSNIKIQNNYIVGGVFTVTNGAVTNSLKNVFIQNNLFSQIPVSGSISVNIACSATDVYNVQFFDNTFVQCGRIVIALTAFKFSGNKIKDAFASFGSVGVATSIFSITSENEYNEFLIENNEINGGSYNSIYFDTITSANRLQIKSNTTDNGIVVKKSSSGITNVLIAENRISGTLTVEETGNIINNIVNATGETHGINVTTDTESLIENNIITGGTNGVNVETISNMILNNKCINQTAYGIRIGSEADNNLVKGNYIKNPGTAIISDNGADNILTDNTEI